jgi:hypothetical protein
MRHFDAHFLAGLLFTAWGSLLLLATPVASGDETAVAA